MDVLVSRTQRGEVGVLRAEQEQVHSDLLPRAVQSQLLIEVCGRAEVLHSLEDRKQETLLCRGGDHSFQGVSLSLNPPELLDILVSFSCLLHDV